MVVETHLTLAILLLASFDLLVQRSHGDVADITSTITRSGEPVFVNVGGMYHHKPLHAAGVVNEICEGDAGLSIHVACCLQCDVEYSMNPAFPQESAAYALAWRVGKEHLFPRPCDVLRRQEEPLVW